MSAAKSHASMRKPPALRPGDTVAIVAPASPIEKELLDAGCRRLEAMGYKAYMTIGGAYYEAILPMIPPRDRVGQIRRYTQWLEQRLSCKVRGMWVPERVWEQSREV